MGATTTSTRGSATGRRTSHPGGSGVIPEGESACCPTVTARTSSSSAAAPPTGRPGSRAAARGRSGSTSPSASSRPPGACRPSSGSSSRSSSASAEAVPFPDASFDLAFSEYGASIWCDPYRLDPRGGAAAAPGRRAGLPRQRHAADPLHALDERAVGPELQRDYFGMHRIEWPDDGSVEFHLRYGDWIRLLPRDGASTSRI